MKDISVAESFLQFMKKDVPGTSVEFAEWKKTSLLFGKEMIPECVRILSYDDEYCHYPAVLALRAYGCQCWANRHGSKRTYSVNCNGSQVEIVPKHTPPDISRN